MNAATVLRVSGLTIRTPAGVPLVEESSFEVGHRELVLLIGPSGSGKTSIINALCGLLDGDEWQVAGRVSYGGREIDLAATRSDLCGLVFQGNALFDDLSAGENPWPYYGEFGKIGLWFEWPLLSSPDGASITDFGGGTMPW